DDNPGPTPTPERLAAGREELGLALAALAELPDRQREVLYLSACAHVRVKVRETSGVLALIVPSESANLTCICIYNALPEPAPALHIVADDRTNSLVLRAYRGKFAEIRDLVKKVDVPGDDAEAPRHKIWTFELRSVEPDENLEAALRLIFGKRAAGNFAVDR